MGCPASNTKQKAQVRRDSKQNPHTHPSDANPQAEAMLDGQWGEGDPEQAHNRTSALLSAEFAPALTMIFK
jgi:hypothetical protein